MGETVVVVVVAYKNLLEKNNAPQRFVVFNLNSLNKLLTFNFFTKEITKKNTTTKNNKSKNNKIIILSHTNVHLLR